MKNELACDKLIEYKSKSIKGFEICETVLHETELDHD